MKNKKIVNATLCSSDGIQFKSKLEKSTYEILKELGFNPSYEPKTFEVWTSFIPVIPFYTKETDSEYSKRIKTDEEKNRLLTLNKKKIIGIKYTPDFYFKFKNLDVYIETKGIFNDTYYIKRKMFRKYLDDLYLNTGQKSVYFEVYTKKQLLQAIEIIKTFKQ